jgi:hypothetical protein
VQLFALKQVITILLSLSLYAPHMAKILAYADCSIILLSNKDPRLCDCNQIITADAVPINADQPDKQKELSLKADWKYTTLNTFRLEHNPAPAKQIFPGSKPLYIPRQALRSIFHPPRA